MEEEDDTELEAGAAAAAAPLGTTRHTMDDSEGDMEEEDDSELEAGTAAAAAPLDGRWVEDTMAAPQEAPTIATQQPADTWLEDTVTALEEVTAAPVVPRRQARTPPEPPPLNAQATAARAAVYWAQRLRLRLTADNGDDDPLEELAGGVIPREHRWARSHSEHRLSVTNTVIFCRRCGCWSAWRLVKLADPCEGPPLNPNDRTRLLSGRSPQTNRDWPGGLSHHTRCAVWRVSTPRGGGGE